MSGKQNWNVFLTQPLLPPGRAILEANASVSEGGTGNPLTEDDMIRLAHNSDAFVSSFAEPYRVFSGRVIEATKNLKVIGWVGAGFDHIDLDVATKHGVYVTYNDVMCPTVADETMALLLAAARRIVPGYQAVRNGDWEKKGYKLYLDFLGTDVHEKTIGIAGLGRIGAQVAQRAFGFDMKIIYTDAVHNLDAESRFGARKVDFDTLCREADFICCCLPHNSATDKMFNAAAFARMKPNAIFVNTSRGKCVDTQALYDALAAKKIDMAALDVLDPEPVPSSHPLLKLPNFLLVPHIAGLTRETREKQAIDVANETIRVLSGYRPRKLLNPDVLKVRPLPEAPAEPARAAN